MHIKVDDVMYRMSGCVMDLQATARDIEDIAAFQGVEPLFRYRLDSAPELLHPVSIDTGGAGNNLRWINQVGRTFAMGIDLCLRHMTQKRARRARVIQVDMGRDNMRDFMRLEAHFVDSRKQRLYCAAGTGIDDSQFVAACEHIGTNNFGLALEWQRDLPCSRAELSESSQSTSTP